MGYKDLLGLAKTTPHTLRVGIVYPDYEEIYRAIALAAGLCFDPVFVGPAESIRRQAGLAGIEKYSVIDSETPEAAATLAVEIASRGEFDLLMKGSVSTAILMKAVLSIDPGIKTGRLLSHVAVFESPDGRFIGISDGGLNISPTVEQRGEIIQNAIELFHNIGFLVPRIALLSGVEILTPSIPSTIESAELAAMAHEGAFPEAIVEGPLSFDLAFNPAASRAKKYPGEIRGNADVLIVPEIVSGNVLGKALNHAASYDSGGVVIGAKIPIVLLSRSDRATEKLNSLLLAGALVYG